MSQTPSSDSYNPPRSLSDHYQRIPSHLQKPNRRTPKSPEEAANKIKFSSDISRSSDINSLGVGTPVSSGYLQEIILPQHAVVIDYNRVEQKVQKQKVKNILEGFQREAEEKAEMLAKAVLAHSEQMNELKKKMEEKTETTKEIINEWYQMKKKELRAIRDGLLQDLKTQEKLFFDNEKFYKEIEQAKKNIEILNGDCKNHHEFYSSIVEADKISEFIQKKREVIEELGNSLLETIDVKVFRQNMESMINVNEKVFMKLEFPEFVDKEKHVRIPGGESVLTTRATFLEQQNNASLFGSVSFAANNLNFSNNLRIAGWAKPKGRLI